MDCLANSEKTDHAGGEHKIAGAAKTVFGNAIKRRAADISKLPQHIRPSKENLKVKDIPTEMKEIIEKLERENKALMNALLERVKLIDMTGNEIQRLRANLQRMQQQNHQLAQSNTQKLAELNSYRDKLRALEHELGCKNGLLIAMKLEAEHNKQNPESENLQNLIPKGQLIKMEDTVDNFKEDEDKEESLFENTKRRRQSKSSKQSKQGQSCANTERKRLSSRRQSSRLKHEEIKAKEDLFQMDDSHLSVPQPSDCDPSQENIERSSQIEAKEIRRPSNVTRPSRQAAMKVNSYKEVPLNVKMRRSE
ncbi:unnamed protein product [Cuscuta campestris]|uniref:Shugoshin C-terminal domain-containing protein n=1 Tax=Cuscuta campestris TaxID=132261 RepID=A0A484M491_9ASTE|nr:unnamed protein product [Cuscuta campestris]